MNLNEICLLNFLKNPNGLNDLSVLLEKIKAQKGTKEVDYNSKKFAV